MKTFNEGTALVLMRRGQVLVRMHTRTGAKWFLADGQLSDDTAQRIVTRSDVKPRDAGLFSGCAQSYGLQQQVRLKSDRNA
jgi:hypothetical protein